MHTHTQVIERNTVMLDESRNTITMPSMIFLRVLSYLNRRRRRGKHIRYPISPNHIPFTQFWQHEKSKQTPLVATLQTEGGETSHSYIFYSSNLIINRN